MFCVIISMNQLDRNNIQPPQRGYKDGTSGRDPINIGTKAPYVRVTRGKLSV